MLGVRIHYPIAVLLCLSFLSQLGCKSKTTDGPPRHETQGTVTFEGQAVPDAQVVFYSQSLRVSRSANTDDQGAFRVQAFSGNGLPEGEYVVVVRPVSGDFVEPGADDRSENRSDIPKKFWKKATTDLKRTISAGENKIDLELSSEG